jgi:diguanylate cyclase (GGDEF)-like protein/PAS domain S-box-containing protein
MVLTDQPEPPGPRGDAGGRDLSALSPGPVWLGPVFSRSPVAMAIIDGFGRVVSVNNALADYLGHDPIALIGTRLGERLVLEDIGRLRAGTVQRRLRHALGHDLWAQVSAVPLPEAGDGAVLVCLDDATGRRHTERVLLHAALHDSLTNLPNRRLLRDRLDTALARAQRTGGDVAVLFLDLDRFKEVNDTLGHDAGDEVLVSVANGILGAMRANDTVARLGGDEFVVICEDLGGEEDLRVLVDRLLLGVRQPVVVRGREVSVSASVGVAVAGPDAITGEDLLRRADHAMLRAKRRPELSYVAFYDDAMDWDDDLAPREERGLSAELRHAIQADLLELHYQPVVRLDGRLVGLEALLRWEHPRLGPLMPADFLPQVAGTELAGSLTDWVLRTAIREAARWADSALRVSVNVWAEQAARPGFADTVGLLLSWAGLHGRSLYLEMHEEELAAAGPGLAEELRRLHDLGVGLVIDDFGAGGTSLVDLRQLPVDTVKVDRGVVARCADDPEQGAVVAAVATAARASGRHPLASGVETREQLRVLRGLGYEGVQGYLTGRPAPLIDLRDLISHRTIALPT